MNKYFWLFMGFNLLLALVVAAQSNVALGFLSFCTGYLLVEILCPEEE